MNLVKYEGQLVEAGADSLDILKDMKKEHLQEIGIPKGHIVKLLRYLHSEEERKEALIPPKQQQQQQKPASAGETKREHPEASKPERVSMAFEACQTQSQVGFGKRLFCEACYLPYFLKQDSDETFCSGTCRTRYRKDNYVQCETCKAYYQRWDCFKSQQAYYCSEACMGPVLGAENRPTAEPEKPWQEQADYEHYLLEEEEQDIPPVDVNEFLEMKRYLKQPYL